MDDRSFTAAQDFLLSAKTFWTTTLYGAVRDSYSEKANHSQDGASDSVEAVAEALEDTTLYQFYAWLERHLQRMKYAGRYGLVPYHEERRREMLEALGHVDTDDRFLELNENLDLPAYYTGVDIHQHPGGVWSDALAGVIYERGARTTTPLLDAAGKDVHERFTDLALAGGSHSNVLDMGCGFGKSTQPFFRRLPDSRIEGVDLAAPCIKLAASLAQKAQSKNVRFRQMNACNTDYANESFDLVTSTMVLHELPPKTLDEFFDEAFRVLSPGGRMVNLDFYCLPDAFRRFIHYGHARRNNESYMGPLAEIDISKLLTSKGFVDVEILPFKETEGVDIDANGSWRFPWTVIAARKPERCGS